MTDSPSSDVALSWSRGRYLFTLKSLQMFGVRQAVLASLPRVSRAQQTTRSLHVSRLAMAVQLKMPSLSPTMEEGTIVKWTKVEFSHGLR